METVEIVQWKVLEQKALLGGGKSRIERQAEAGKLTARARIAMLLDEESFTEIDRLACSPFSNNGKEYTDGVITGYGTVNGRQVALYAQDFTIRGGSLGKRHAEKICKVMDMAAKIGCPIIGIIDSGGARIDEGIHALVGYAQIFKRNCHLSGVVPQISLILGPCAGGAVYSPALTDFVFMTENISQMFITGPQVIQEVLHQTVTKEELGGSSAHASKSGVAHVISSTEAECFEKVKQLLSYLPSSYLDPAYALRGFGGQAQLDAQLDKNKNIIPTNPNQSYNVKDVINNLVDQHSFFEIQELFAGNIIVGFARLDNSVIGIVANQPAIKAGTIDIDASCKAARFINFCDSFGIPLVTLVDTPGYLPGIDQEHNGIIKHGAKLLAAYATATIPKITLILRKAFGGAYIVMGSKDLGADFNFAWPLAQIAVMGSKGAVSIMHGRALALETPEQRVLKQQELEQEYHETFLNPYTAAEHGYIDAIIEPHDTRDHLIRALKITRDKVEKLPARKRHNLPV